MIDDRRLDELLAEALLESVPPRHPRETDRCPPIPMLVTMGRRELDPQVIEHVANCRRCRVVLLATWASDEDKGLTPWSRVFAAAAADAADPVDRDGDALIASDALLAVAPQLSEARLPRDVAGLLETACTRLADDLFELNRPVADELRALAFALRHATPNRRFARSDAPEAWVRDRVGEWAGDLAEVGTPEALRTARALYRSIGDRHAAGLCSRELAAALDADDRATEARVERAMAGLELDVRMAEERL